MIGRVTATDTAAAGGFFRRLARDASANTLALVAAAILPLMGMVGGGVDMSRAYLAQSRLQQACDAGVLAARKRLGSNIVVDGIVPDEVAQFGNRFFNLNYQDGIYATKDRTFQMVLENDYSISATAQVNVPTAVMGIFGFTNVPIKVDCQAKLSFAALDIMMVLDVTGSMRLTNDGDSMSRIDSLKQTITNFHAQLESTPSAGAGIRYGFVPYATNVNVGHLLQDDWVVDRSTYQSRESGASSQTTYTKIRYTNFVIISGTDTGWKEQSKYKAPKIINPSEAGDTHYCDQPTPAGNKVSNNVTLSEQSEPVLGPPAGTKTTKRVEKSADGTEYRTALEGKECKVYSRVFTNFVQQYDEIREPAYGTVANYIYKPVLLDTTGWRSSANGCMEERLSSEIFDFSNVDLTLNMDLDLDLVPNVANPDTQWRPRFTDIVYARSFNNNGNGSFTTEEVATSEQFAQTGTWWFSNCPAPARKLGPITATELTAYLGTLTPEGATYHDGGMIWGGRLLSPTGLYASENSDAATGEVKNRSLIFLTDGQTNPYDLAYSAYGIEGLDQRRWSPSSAMTLTETIDARFAFACEEVKKRNITVFVIAFGTTVNNTMTECAGAGRYFEAADSVQLKDAFDTIARSLGDLRIAR